MTSWSDLFTGKDSEGFDIMMNYYRKTYPNSTKSVSNSILLADVLNRSGNANAFQSNLSVIIPPPAKEDTSVQHYPPYSEKLRVLFTEAINSLNRGDRLSQVKVIIPLSWADKSTTEGYYLHYLVDHESDGYIGSPNYTYRNWKPPQGASISWITNKTEWPNLWNYLALNVTSGNPNTAESQWVRAFSGVSSGAIGLGQLKSPPTYMEGGYRSLGNPVEEAKGMLRYIIARYGTVTKAYNFKIRKGWY